MMKDTLENAPEYHECQEESKTVHFDEHEFYMAFNGDEDCTRFKNWLAEVGWKSYQKYWYKREREIEAIMEK